MKTYVVISDSHGRRRQLEKVAALFAENDHIVHLGDGSSDMRPYLAAFPEKIILLRGNCDLSAGQEECVIEEEGVRVFCCHGHKYGVKSGRERLAAAAKAQGCHVALYGHTHTARIETVDGVLCVNPGALGDYTDAGYCYLVLHKGKATPALVSLD